MNLPLKIFDRYVIGIFIRQLLFAVLAAVLIFIVVDLIEHLDKFIDKKVPLEVVVQYYGYFLPYIIYLVLPVGVLLAALFTIGGLSRTHELTAMKASGISLHRILLHLLVLGILLTGWRFVFGETVVPYSNKQNKDIYRYHVKGVSPRKAGRRGDIYLRNHPDQLVHIKHFDSQSGQIFNLDWQSFAGEVMQKRITAKKAFWKDSAWVLEGGRRWTFTADSTYLDKFALQPYYDLGFIPEDLTKVQTNPEEMGYWQLQKFVDRLKSMGGDPLKWEVELACKAAMPWTCAIVLLLGVPIAAHYRRSGLSISFGIGLFISFVYFALQQIGRVLGFNGTVSPVVAAWLGNAVFVLIGLYLYWRVEK
ncbi:LPS export ABC transporter permease LptG [candidate division LCP-89 bacterium B3_LCP]|uniref:LPS export ABC transporter permease LptG n=1 Tax=candidate division LCP-89 bacterium B3_LCP TaxID=2012998 RepID=A0A532V2E9_UNCL8|nr:MAG: LPS export ABC transporter permease LptG [candidate division LCP-89 bacterium B3_LCP]